MDEPFDMDAALIELLRQETQKHRERVALPFEDERRHLRELFDEQYVAVYSDTDLFLRQLYGEQVDEEVQGAQHDRFIRESLDTIEAASTLVPGDCMRIGGEGFYLHSTSDAPQDTPVLDGQAMLDEGATVTGDFASYAVDACMLSYEQFTRIDDGTEPHFDETPTLWMQLDAAVVRNQYGEEVRYDSLAVPLFFDSLRFEQLVPRDELLAPNIEAPREAPRSQNVLASLRGPIFQELCNDIENDLNHNEYEPGELIDLRRTYHEQLIEKTADIPFDAPLSLWAQDAEEPQGGIRFVMGERVYYAGPTIIKYPSAWRVVHGFSLVNESEETVSLVHVLPENIQSAEIDHL